LPVASLVRTPVGNAESSGVAVISNSAELPVADVIEKTTLSPTIG